MVAIGAAYAGKTLIKVTTFQVLPNYMGNYRTEEAIFTGKEIVVTVIKVIKVIIEQLPGQRVCNPPVL